MRSVRYGLVFETFEQHKYKHGFVLMSYVSISVILYSCYLCFLFMSGRRTKSTTKESKKKKYKEKKIQRKKKLRKKKNCSEWYSNLYESTPQIRSQVLYPFGYGVSGIQVDVVLPIYQFHLSARGAVYLVILI